MKKVKESSIEAYFVATVKELGGITFKFANSGTNGVPDRIVCFQGGVISFCELKRPGETPRPLQKVVGTMLRNFGFDVWWASDKEKIRSHLLRLKELSNEKGEVLYEN